MAPCAAKRKELDNWLDEASGTFDIKRRQELYSKVQRYIVENVLWVPILSDVCLYGVNKNLNFAAIGEFPQFHKCSWK
jgi:ABC-type transport system substrate-binding protein